MRINKTSFTSSKAAPSPQNVNQDHVFSVLVVAATAQFVKGSTSKSLLEINGELLLDRQIRIISEKWPGVEILVLVGYQAKQIMGLSKSHVRFIEIENYANNSLLKNIGMGLRACLTESVLICVGNLVVNKDIFDIPLDKNCVVIDTQKRLSKDYVGVTYNKSANIFSYGLPSKWANIAYLTGKTLEAFKELAWGEKANLQLVHEAFNELLDNNHKIDVIEPPTMKLVIVETNDDVNKARVIW